MIQLNDLRNFTSYLRFLNFGMRRLRKLLPKFPSDANSMLFYKKKCSRVLYFICSAGKGLVSLPAH